MRSMLKVAVAVSAVVASGAFGGGPTPSAGAIGAATTHFVPLSSPTRLVDSRTGVGTARGPIAAQTARDLQITGGLVPASATAVLINLTATGTQGGGWLQVFPTGNATIGSSSTLNLDFGGTTLPNASFAPLGSGGRLTVYSTFTTDVLVDVVGYFEPATVATSGRFLSVSPTRILDTRTRLGWVPANPGDVKNCTDFANQADAQEWFDAYRDLFGDVAHLDGNSNGTACEPDEQPPATAAPTPTPTPAPAPAPAPGNPGDTKNCTDFATYADAKAWFDTYFPYYGDVAKLDANGDGIPCESLPGSPKKYLDGRTDGKVLAGTTITLQVTGVGGVPPTGVSAVVLNVTAAGPKSEGWVQVAPSPVTVGASSNLNTSPGITVANLVVVPVGASGRIDLYSTTGGDLLADVFGYFTDGTASSSSTGLFVPIAPSRVLDTRPASGGRGISGGATIGLGLASVVGTASAITGNLTATNAAVNGYLQLSPAPIHVGAHSNVNVSYDGQTIANAFVSPVAGSDAGVQIYTLYTADAILDLTGYFTAG